MKTFFKLENDLSARQAVLLGFSSRSLCSLLLIPITVIKTRFESECYTYLSIRNALKTIYFKEGIRGLSSGLMPTILRDASFSALYLMFYTQTKKFLTLEKQQKQENTICINVASATNACLLASLLTQPFDVIKTRMQLYPKQYSTLRHTSADLVRTSGFKGFLQGFSFRFARRILQTAFSWTLFEELSKISQPK